MCPFINQSLDVVIQQCFFTEYDAEDADHCLVQSQCCSDDCFRNGFAFRVDVQFLGELVNDRHGVIRLEIVIHFGNELCLQILEQSQLLGIIGQCRNGILEAVVGILIGDFYFLQIDFGFFDGFFAVFYRTAVMRSSEEETQHLRIDFLQDIMHRHEVPERLAHLLGCFTDCDEAVVHPVVRESFAGLGFALRNLVLVVRESQVMAAAVDIDGIAQIFGRHHRAFDVPARASRTPR